MPEQAIDNRQVAHAEDILRDHTRRITFSQDGVMVVRQDQETSIIDSSVERVIVSDARPKSRLLRFEHCQNCKVAHPFFYVHDFADFLNIGGVRSIVDDVEHVNEVTPVVIALIGLLGVTAAGVGADAGSLISEISDVPRRLTAVKISRWIIRELMLDEIAVDRFQGNIRTELGRTAVRQVGAVHANLDRARKLGIKAGPE